MAMETVILHWILANTTFLGNLGINRGGLFVAFNKFRKMRWIRSLEMTQRDTLVGDFLWKEGVDVVEVGWWLSSRGQLAPQEAAVEWRVAMAGQFPDTRSCVKVVISDYKWMWDEDPVVESILMSLIQRSLQREDSHNRRKTKYPTVLKAGLESTTRPGRPAFTVSNWSWFSSDKLSLRGTTETECKT